MTYRPNSWWAGFVGCALFALFLAAVVLGLLMLGYGGRPTD
jgi:hypothetical protein